MGIRPTNIQLNASIKLINLSIATHIRDESTEQMFTGTLARPNH